VFSQLPGRRGDLGATGGHTTAGRYSAAGSPPDIKPEFVEEQNTTAASAAERAKIRAN
jgi:hypothetical protein